MVLPLLLLPACGIGRSSLKVPVSQWPGYDYFPLARQWGLDQREGLQLELPAYANPQDIVHAYLRGDLQIAQLTTVEAVDLCVRIPRRCPVVVLVLDQSVGGDQVVVNRTLGSIAELRGHPVAITPSSLGPYVLSRALERHGLTLADVDLRPMPLEDMPGALQRGEVAAAALFPPFSDQALQRAPVRPLFTSREIPNEIFDVLVVDPAILSSQRPALVKLLRTWESAHGAARSRPAQAIAVMAAREGLSPEAFGQALEGLAFLPLQAQEPLFADGGVLDRNLARLRAVQAQLGLMAVRGPLPVVDGSLLRAALQVGPSPSRLP